MKPTCNVTPVGYITMTKFCELHGKKYSKQGTKKLRASGDLIDVGDHVYVKAGTPWPLVRTGNFVTRMREFARTARAAEYAGA